jgi:phosphoglycolate phosphatase
VKEAEAREHRVVSAASAKPWDTFDTYLFDIDGTLLRAMGGVHNDAFPDSVRQVMQRDISLERVILHGNTDTRILAQAFEHAGVPRETWQPYRQQLLDKMCELVRLRRAEIEILMMPGIRAALDHLQQKQKTLGVATGNLEQIGWLKVELAGLRDYFVFGGFSDRFEDRGAMIGAAAAQGRMHSGPDSSVCVVGDTPSDIAAAKVNGLSVIAVATGAYSVDELLEHQPDIAASSLPALLESIGANKPGS